MFIDRRPGHFWKPNTRLVQDQTGAGAIFTLALVLVSGLAALGGLQVASLWLRFSQLQHSADTIALAAADAKIGLIGRYPCELAERLAAANLAKLENCRIVGFVVHLELSSSSLGIVHYAKASAGPSLEPNP